MYVYVCVHIQGCAHAHVVCVHMSDMLEVNLVDLQGTIISFGPGSLTGLDLVDLAKLSDSETQGSASPIVPAWSQCSAFSRIQGLTLTQQALS